MKNNELIPDNFYFVKSGAPYEEAEWVMYFGVLYGRKNPFILFKKRYYANGFDCRDYYDYTYANPSQIKQLEDSVSSNAYMDYFEDTTISSSTTVVSTTETDKEKAEKMYPKGTMFESPMSGGIFSSSGEFGEDSRGIYTNGSFVCYRGKWAKITQKSPEFSVAGVIEKLSITEDAIKYLTALGYTVKMEKKDAVSS